MNYHWSELVFVVCFVAYTTIRGRFIRQSKGIESTERRLDWLERVLLTLVFLGNLLLPIVYLTTPIFSFADYELPVWANVFGTILMPFVLWMFWRSHVDLGQNWSPTLEIRKNHRLVQQGLYARVRHPMYAAILLFGLAQGLLLHNWLAGWSGLASFLLLYLARAPREERMLQRHFGDEYAAYMRRTGRLFPRIITR